MSTPNINIPTLDRALEPIKIWLKLGELFIDQSNIRSIARFGKDTKIEFLEGEDIVVRVDYDKVREMLPSSGR